MKEGLKYKVQSRNTTIKKHSSKFRVYQKAEKVQEGDATIYHIAP